MSTKCSLNPTNGGVSSAADDNGSGTRSTASLNSLWLCLCPGLGPSSRLRGLESKALEDLLFALRAWPAKILEDARPPHSFLHLLSSPRIPSYFRSETSPRWQQRKPPASPSQAPPDNMTSQKSTPTISTARPLRGESRMKRAPCHTRLETPTS